MSRSSCSSCRPVFFVSSRGRNRPIRFGWCFISRDVPVLKPPCARQCIGRRWSSSFAVLSVVWRGGWRALSQLVIRSDLCLCPRTRCQKWASNKSAGQPRACPPSGLCLRLRDKLQQRLIVLLLALPTLAPSGKKAVRVRIDRRIRHRGKQTQLDLACLNRVRERCLPTTSRSQQS